MFHIFSLVCFLIHGVKSRSGHDRSPTVGSISHVSGPKLTFDDSAWLCVEKLKKHCFETKNFKHRQQISKKTNPT